MGKRPLFSKKNREQGVIPVVSRNETRVEAIGISLVARTALT
jgi:hypothetical protein